MSKNERVRDSRTFVFDFWLTFVRRLNHTVPFLQVKKETKFQKIVEAYAQRKGINGASLRFMIDGERVQPDSTPKMLELEDNDQVDVMLETVGGRLETQAGQSL